MNIHWTLQTGHGSWNPILWLLAFIVAMGLAWLIRARGRRDNRAGDALKPFISGNEEPADGAGHIPASNLYWGFTDSLKAYYQKITPLHSGRVTDYLTWMLGVTAVMMIVVLII